MPVEPLVTWSSGALQSEEFELVITDYNLKWSNGGTSYAPSISTAQCPVIMFTATETQEIAVNAMKAGLDDYVIKVRNITSPGGGVRSCLDSPEIDWRALRTETRLQDAASIGLNLECSINDRWGGR